MKGKNDWVLMGAGAVMGGAVAATVTAAWGMPGVLTRFLSPLKEETIATLVAGAAAILAALMTVAIIRYQVWRSDWHERDRRRRRARAAQSTLPLALVELWQYADACMAFHGVLRHCFSGSSLQPGKAQTILQQHPLPIIPSGSINVFKECIEFEDDDVAEALSDLIAVLQVQNSRLRTVKDFATQCTGARLQILLPLNVDQGIVDAADVAARCSKLLSYGRQERRNHGLVPDRAEIRSAMWQSKHLDDVTHSDAFERAESWKPMNWSVR